MFKGFVLFILLLSTGLPCFAQRLRWDFESYTSAQGAQQNADNLIDPTARRIENPRSQIEVDLRLNTKIIWKKNTRFVFRPRLIGNLKQFHYLDTDETKNTTTAKASLPESYLENDTTSKLTLAIGLQNYQWGPAEFIGPSNPFFHFRAGQKAFSFKENGRALLRSNWSPNAKWSLIALAEPVNNGDSFWIYDQKFKPKGVIKLERRGENALNYLGLEVGTIDDNIPFVGEYFNFELFEGLSMYLDARHSNGSAKYEPELSEDGLYDMNYIRDTEVKKTLLVTGLRWEGGVDIRIEYIYNSYGLTKELLTAAFSSAVSLHPRGDENLKRLLGSGMELLGQHYGYISFRIPDLFVQNNNLAFRYLRSLMDQSGNLQVAADTAVGDAWTLFCEGNISIGDNTQELSALEKASGQLGIKWNY